MGHNTLTLFCTWLSHWLRFHVPSFQKISIFSRIKHREWERKVLGHWGLSLYICFVYAWWVCGSHVSFDVIYCLKNSCRLCYLWYTHNICLLLSGREILPHDNMKVKAFYFENEIDTASDDSFSNKLKLVLSIFFTWKKYLSRRNFYHWRPVNTSLDIFSFLRYVRCY